MEELCAGLVRRGPSHETLHPDFGLRASGGSKQAAGWELDSKRADFATVPCRLGRSGCLCGPAVARIQRNPTR